MSELISKRPERHQKKYGPRDFLARLFYLMAVGFRPFPGSPEIPPRPSVERTILANQIEQVRNLTSEEILSGEKRKQIVDVVTYGLEWMATEIRSSQEELTSLGATLSNTWPMREFIRSALIKPLPPLDFQAAEFHPQLLKQAEVADGCNWWLELNEGQKEAFMQILEEDFGLGEEAERIEIDEGEFEGYSLVKSRKPITVLATGDWPGNAFYPTLVFSLQGELYLTCFPTD